MRPLQTTFYAPPKPPINFYITRDISKLQLTVHWIDETFGGQDVEWIRVFTNRKDGNCGQYCEIAVAENLNEISLTDLIPGRR